MKKRFLCTFLSASMVLTLCGCAGTVATNDAAVDYSTGSPWIDSNIPENVENSGEVDLKDNFDLAVNRQWVIDNPIKSGEMTNNFLQSFEDERNNRLYDILEDDSYKDDHNAELVQTYYSSFLDWDARDAAGTDPLIPYLEEIEAIESFDDFAEYSVKTDSVFTRILYPDITENPDNADEKLLYISSPVWYLNDAAEYADLDEMSDYTALTYKCAKEKVETVLSKCGYSEDEIDEIFEGAIEFERLFAANCYTQAELSLTETSSAMNGQIYTSGQLADYGWYSILNELAVNYGIGDIDKIQLYEKMDYFENLDTILCEDNLDLIKDYLLAHTASTNIGNLDKDSFYAFLDIYNEQMGGSGYQDEKKYALEYTELYLGWPLSKLYVDRYVSAEEKQAIYDVIGKIIAGYKEMLTEEDFLSEETRVKAIEKLDKLRINCMYPDDWSDYDYSDLTLSDNYFEVCLEISDYLTKREFKEFKDPVNKDLWADTPITLNAFYAPTANSINICCGLVGNVLYNEDMPKEEAYAKVGGVIGHEISHAFDPNGANYDADGNYKTWWTDEDYANFEKLTDKLVAYYDNITIWDGFHCSGELSKGEACADMGGVAVMLHIAASEPDFDYETFFKSYARLWADSDTPNFTYYQGNYDEHPLNYLRTNVTVAQFEKFYETFGVEKGDGMYIASEDRVKIW